MKTDYTDHWPTCHTQADAGLPSGNINVRRREVTSWRPWLALGVGLGLNWLALGVGLGLILGGLLS